MRRFPKIMLVASAGGHLSQLLSLQSIWKDYDVVCVSTGQMVRDKLEAIGQKYIVGECNRKQPLRVIKVLLRCIKVVFRERPDIIISTGAAVGCIMCFLGKLLGAKVIWLDSIANIEKISLSGRMVRYIADLFLVQWPELVERYKHVEYAGSVI